jgi:hypothetical protein
MWLDRALQFHVAALAVLGAIFVGLRHEATVVPALAAIAAVAAFLVTDVLAWVRLNRWAANAIIVVAVGWSLREFIQISPDEKLMAIASMLCYLQIVLLFQEKGARIYWQLIVLSTLEVVVAAALDLGPQFGLLLALYAVIAIGALVLLCIHRETRGRAPAPADSLEAKMRSRSDRWKAQAYPFGSEMPWDSTGQEEVYAWATYFGYKDKADVTLNAILGYDPAIPHWGYNGSARRYWDFLYGGKLERVPYRDDRNDLDGLAEAANRAQARIVVDATPPSILYGLVRDVPMIVPPRGRMPVTSRAVSGSRSFSTSPRQPSAIPTTA